MKLFKIWRSWLSDRANRIARFLINREDVGLEEFQLWLDYNPRITHEGYIERIELMDRLSEEGSTNFVASAQTWLESPSGEIKSDKKTIALKICIPYSAPGPGRHHRLSMVLGSFSDEIRINNLVRSTNIEGVVRPLGGGQAGRILFFKMEFIRGDHLGDLMKPDLSQREFYTRVAQLGYLANTISQLHHYHVVHMDLKPKNLLFCRYPGSIREGKILVCDFGYSNSRLRDTVQRYGGQLSPVYSAPEQALLSQPNLTRAVDYFSFGAIAHEYLTGRLLHPRALEIFSREGFKVTPRYLEHIKTGRENRIEDPQIRELIDQLTEYESQTRMQKAPDLFQVAHTFKEVAQANGIDDINTQFLDAQLIEYAQKEASLV